jgi:putative DNA primase/helicase
MTPLDLVVSKLRSAGCDPAPTGPDDYESRCPAHRGKRKNLSLRAGDDGRVLLYCHHCNDNGGPSCSTEAIVAALGLGMEDLFPVGSAVRTEGMVREGMVRGGMVRVGMVREADPTGGEGGRPAKRSYSTPEEALAAIARKIEPRPVKTQSWVYYDQSGQVVMVVGRFDAADGAKTYRPVHRQREGSWAIGDPLGLLPLYRLPELAPASRITIVEGEKCADAAGAIGCVATTSAHGAEAPQKTDWTPLAGKDLAIVPDNDAPGEGYATSLLRIFNHLDPRPTVRIIRLPGLAEGEDIADWLPRVMQGRSGEDAVQHSQAEYERLWNEAPVVDLETVGSGQPGRWG